MKDMRRLYDHVIEKFGSVEATYAAFEQRPSSANTPENGAEAPDSSPGSGDKVSKGLSPKDMLAGCRLCGFQSSHDPRVLFNYLDAAHTGRVTQNEFAMLKQLD